MKKIFTSILALTLAFSLFGCGPKESPPETDTSVDNTTEAKTQASSEIACEDPESSDTATDTAAEAETEERVILELEDITSEEENIFTCTSDGVKHDFILCLPDVTENAPLVVMLHGYAGSAEGFKRDTAFDETATPAGYAVCYVTGAPNPNDSTSATGWNSYVDDTANDDVGFLIALAEYLKTEYNFDENRIYAVGFSNGAFMIHSLAMEAGDTYSGFVSVAGFMQQSVWETPNASNDISFFQITGEKDDVVPKNSDGSAKHSNAPAIEDVMEYWVSSNGLSLSETAEIGVDSESILNKYTSEDKKNQVWDLFVKNGRHSWPSTSLNEIDTNSLILEFFESIEPAEKPE